MCEKLGVDAVGDGMGDVALPALHKSHLKPIEMKAILKFLVASAPVQNN